MNSTLKKIRSRAESLPLKKKLVFYIGEIPLILPWPKEASSPRNHADPRPEPPPARLCAAPARPRAAVRGRALVARGCAVPPGFGWGCGERGRERERERESSSRVWFWGRKISFSI